MTLRMTLRDVRSLRAFLARPEIKELDGETPIVLAVPGEKLRRRPKRKPQPIIPVNSIAQHKAAVDAVKILGNDAPDGNAVLASVGSSVELVACVSPVEGGSSIYTWN